MEEIQDTKSYIADEDREVLLVMMLNTKNQVVGLHRAHVGSLNVSIVHPSSEGGFHVYRKSSRNDQLLFLVAWESDFPLLFFPTKKV